MKVVHLTTVHSPFDTRIFHKQARTLAQAGYEVVLIAPHTHDEVVDGIHIRALPKPRHRWERILGLSWRAFQLARQERASLYHFHDPELIPIGILLKISTGSRVVYDVHEDYSRQILTKHWLPKPSRHIARWGIQVWEKLAARILDGIVAATPAISEKFPPEKTVVVRNFPRLPMFRDQKIPYHQRPPWVVYIGWIAEVRGASVMVDAIAHVQTEATLILAGAFDEASLHTKLARRPGWKRTRYLGWLQRPQVAEILGKARVGLVVLAPLSRYQESMPVKLFEYMAAGIPFVASDFPFWRELAEGAGLFVTPDDPRAVAQAIQWLLTHPDEARAMGERGRWLVETRYNWNWEAERLLQFYAQLLG
ncbi:MAG: glycosyltransferase family 4 protein [Gammaproteobacteria bacterium]|nr:glycosyltransferase family 4 protein [Gammaproteobacteria bacterium]